MGNFLRKYSSGYKNHTFGNNPPPPTSQRGVLDSTGQRHCSCFLQKGMCAPNLGEICQNCDVSSADISPNIFWKTTVNEFRGPGQVVLISWSWVYISLPRWLSGNSLTITKVGVVSSVSTEHYECFQWYSIIPSTASALACTDLSLSNVLIVTTEAHFGSRYRTLCWVAMLHSTADDLYVCACSHLFFLICILRVLRMLR